MKSVNDIEALQNIGATAWKAIEAAAPLKKDITAEDEELARVHSAFLRGSSVGSVARELAKTIKVPRSIGIVAEKLANDFRMATWHQKMLGKIFTAMESGREKREKEEAERKRLAEEKEKEAVDEERKLIVAAHRKAGEFMEKYKSTCQSLDVQLPAWRWRFLLYTTCGLRGETIAPHVNHDFDHPISLLHYLSHIAQFVKVQHKDPLGTSDGFGAAPPPPPLASGLPPLLLKVDGFDFMMPSIVWAYVKTRNLLPDAQRLSIIGALQTWVP